MGIIRHSEGSFDQPSPGISRVTIVERKTGAGALTTRIVTIEPGAETPRHWHRVEESMMVLEGEGQAILGDQVMDIKAGETLLGRHPPRLYQYRIRPDESRRRLSRRGRGHVRRLSMSSACGLEGPCNGRCPYLL